MRWVEGQRFTADQAWGSTLLGDFGAVAARLHWTDAPYRWHTNTGPEVFAVLQGEVEMHYRDESGREHMRLLGVGDIACLSNGDEHVAIPRGPARILVVEMVGSD